MNYAQGTMAFGSDYFTELDDEVWLDYDKAYIGMQVFNISTGLMYKVVELHTDDGACLERIDG